MYDLPGPLGLELIHDFQDGLVVLIPDLHIDAIVQEAPDHLDLTAEGRLVEGLAPEGLDVDVEPLGQDQIDHLPADVLPTFRHFLDIFQTFLDIF